MKENYSPIGVFDSGYGGLTILREIRKVLPQYDYLYLGDNARAPYGSRSFDIVYKFTLQAVNYLFSQGCRLVILACNTASAKALRTIQQNDLPKIDPSRRVLGVIRPTVEEIAKISKNGHIGIVGTPGTIQSESYNIEIAKLHPTFTTIGQACALWAAIVECGEAEGDGADFFVKKDIDALFSKDHLIDALILGCTHYPLLLNKIKKYVPQDVHIIEQGGIVANSLADYLVRHADIEATISKNSDCKFLTTESASKFTDLASIFIGKEITATQITL